MKIFQTLGIFLTITTVQKYNHRFMDNNFEIPKTSDILLRLRLGSQSYKLISPYICCLPSVILERYSGSI